MTCEHPMWVLHTVRYDDGISRRMLECKRCKAKQPFDLSEK
jgi:hypothetical protein